MSCFRRQQSQLLEYIDLLPWVTGGFPLESVFRRLYMFK